MRLLRPIVRSDGTSIHSAEVLHAVPGSPPDSPDLHARESPSPALDAAANAVPPDISESGSPVRQAIPGRKMASTAQRH